VVNDQRPAPAYLDEITPLMQRLIKADDPSIPAAAIMAALHDHLESEEFATSLYLVWGVLGEGEWQAEQAVEAAREWLVLDHGDREAVRRYYDHWLYDVCGYDRP
jgi:hypothetical protein